MTAQHKIEKAWKTCTNCGATLRGKEDACSGPDRKPYCSVHCFMAASAK